jgi:hypothetical protein
VRLSVHPSFRLSVRPSIRLSIYVPFFSCACLSVWLALDWLVGWLCACVCMCACVRACVRAYVRVCVRRSVGPCVLACVRACVRTSVCPSICPSVCSSVCPFVRLSVRVCMRASVHLSARPSVCPSVRPTICVPVCLCGRRLVGCLAGCVYVYVNTSQSHHNNNYTSQSYPTNINHKKTHHSHESQTSSLWRPLLKHFAKEYMSSEANFPIRFNNCALKTSISSASRA